MDNYLRQKAVALDLQVYTATGLEAETNYTASIRVKYDVDGNDVYSFDTGVTM